MKKEMISFELKKSTVFVFKSRKNKSRLFPTVTVTDPTNGTAITHTCSIIIFDAG
ncbi:hypothetical protein [Pedobacter gandavensis]|uniref:hypothetical protein n=1 Tax=Pedobacter gandavensis TaxID=2679963 RepID=UPI00292F6927|nr:hypothetical protein [Pedobacter gandavensis]